MAMTALAVVTFMEASIDRVGASGTNQVAVMTQGVEAVSETIRSEQGVGQMAFILIAVVAASILIGHAAGGLFGFLFATLAVGVFMQGREFIEGIGITAAGL